MSGVQEDVTCPQCKEPEACMTEYETRTGEECEFCTRCGYSKRLVILRDRRKTTQIRTEAKKLIEQGKVEEALKLTGCCCVEDLEDFLKYFRFFKMTKEGHRIYRIYERKGYGAFEVALNGIRRIGHLYQDDDKRQKQIQHLLSIRDQYDVKITEVLADGTIKEY